MIFSTSSLDDVAQVERLEDQVERALERDLFAEVDRDRRVAVDAFLAQAARVEVDVDARQLGESVHHFGERRFLVLQQHRRLQAAFDFQLTLGAALRCDPSSLCDLGMKSFQFFWS